MKLYEKYLFSKVSTPVIVIAMAITSIAWLTQSLRFFDYIADKGLSVSTFLYLTSLILPSLLWVVIPFSVFIGVVYSLYKIHADSELIVLQSSGASNYDLLKPILRFAAFSTVVSYAIGLYFLPASYREFKEIENFIKNNYASIVLDDGVFSSPIDGLTIYVKEKELNGDFIELIAHDIRDETKIITVTAQKGRLINSDKGAVFQLQNGSHQELDRESNLISLLYFERYELLLDPFKGSITGERYMKPKERYLNELFASDEDLSDEQIYKMHSEGHYRLTWPLYNIFLTILACVPFLSFEFNRKFKMKPIVYVSIFALAVMVAALMLKSLSEVNEWLYSIMYIKVIFLSLFVYLKVAGFLSMQPRSLKPAKN